MKVDGALSASYQFSKIVAKKRQKIYLCGRWFWLLIRFIDSATRWSFCSTTSIKFYFNWTFETALEKKTKVIYFSPASHPIMWKFPQFRLLFHLNSNCLRQNGKTAAEMMRNSDDKQFGGKGRQHWETEEWKGTNCSCNKRQLNFSISVPYLAV